ncbi:HAD family hydrolase [Ruminococcaceae bacterium OttesenSCG-928-A16]|nr:HAD family hydrolase [Ruminococcaceae bacterium OttesenSCG-928-A16]
MKQYKAIFFDWDGTAVLSRKAPVEEAVLPMKKLLQKGVPLAIISGTTYENIAGGKLESYFTAQELKSLFLGLGRGAYNYRFNAEGKPAVYQNHIPKKEVLLAIHDVCYEMHKQLLKEYGMQTDIVFSRPGYCKIDLMVEVDRGENLFLQQNELQTLNNYFEKHGYHGKLEQLMQLGAELGQKKGVPLKITSDAKYLEVGTTDKSDNVDGILSTLEQEQGIAPQDCCYWGDEYLGLGQGLFGSDSFMMTKKTLPGDFFDVSETEGERPAKVQHLGGGVDRFLDFLHQQC